jgi:hypothetical protein
MESIMSNIKTKHTGGFSATKPSVGKGGHPEQVPGNADSRPDAKMRFSGHGMNSTTTAAAKK